MSSKDDDGKPAVRIDAHIVRVKGQGLVRVPGRKGYKPGVILTVPSRSAPTFTRRKLAAGPHGPLFAEKCRVIMVHRVVSSTVVGNCP
jgi:hypothetical protein